MVPLTISIGAVVLLQDKPDYTTGLEPSYATKIHSYYNKKIEPVIFGLP